MHKHIAQTLPAIRTLAERTHPDDDEAREEFVLEHLTAAARTLGSEDPETHALEVLDMEDEGELEQSDEETAPVSTLEVLPAATPVPVEQKKATKKKKANKRK